MPFLLIDIVPNDHFLPQTMHRSTGSLLHKQCPVGKRVTRGPDMSLLHSDQIRFFSPREMLSMFGFPDSYSLPDSMSNRHKYRVIGQSVNVVTVQAMMHSVLCSASWSVENKYLKERRDVTLGNSADDESAKKRPFDELVSEDSSIDAKKKSKS